MTRIIHVFPKTDLRCGHIGLAAIAAKAKRHVENLDPTDFLFFLNTAQNQFKLLGAKGLLVHWKAPDNRRVVVEAIKHIPLAFQGDEFDFNIAVKASLKETMGKRFKG